MMNTIAEHKALVGNHREHESRLAKFLRLAEHAGGEEKRQILATLPRDLAITHDGRVQRVRELLQNTNISDTPLIQAELYSTVIEGARPYVCFRDAVNTVRMKSKTLTLPAGKAAGYLSKVAEGADIPAEETYPDGKTLTAEKYGVRPIISSELVDDGEFDVVALHVSHFGAAAENTINQIVLTDMMDNAGKEDDAADTTADQGITQVVNGMAEVSAAGFQPDTLVMSPTLAAVLLDELKPSSAYWDHAGTFQTGQVSQMLGLRAYTCGVADDSSSRTWRYTTNDDIGGLVFDKARSNFLGIRRDISVENYKDNVKDILGLAITMRVGTEITQSNAICRLRY